MEKSRRVENSAKTNDFSPDDDKKPDGLQNSRFLEAEMDSGYVRILKRLYSNQQEENEQKKLELFFSGEDNHGKQRLPVIRIWS